MGAPADTVTTICWFTAKRNLFVPGFADIVADALSHEIGLAQGLAQAASSHEHCAGLADS